MRDSASVRAKSEDAEVLFEWRDFDGDDCFKAFDITLTNGTEAERFEFGECVVSDLRKSIKFFHGQVDRVDGAFRFPDIRTYELKRTADGFHLQIRIEGSDLSRQVEISSPRLIVDDEFLNDYDDHFNCGETETMDERAVKLAVEYLDSQFAKGEPADLPGMLMHVDFYERVVMVREEVDEVLRRYPSVYVMQDAGSRIFFTKSFGSREISDEDLARNIQMYRDDFAVMEEGSQSRWKTYKIDKGVLELRRAALELRRKGMESLLSGRPAEAEGYFRTALATPKLSKSDRVHALVCLGDSLIDQGRYPEAQESLAKALEEGDATGSGQESMAELLLIQGSDPRRALQLTEYSMTLAARRPSQDELHALLHLGRQVTYWSRKARALVQLGRGSEAQTAVEMASKIAEEWKKAEPDRGVPAPAEQASSPPRILSADLIRAGMIWAIAKALFAIGEPMKAMEYFRSVRHIDPKGKYRLLAEQEIKRFESV